MTTVRSFLLALCCGLASVPAVANLPAIDGALAAPLASALAQPRLAGQVRYTFWGFDVYEARLWVGPGFDASALALQPYALELTYRRSFSGRAIAERSIEEMRRIGDVSEAQARRWQEAMERAFPDVAPGDRLTGIHLPGQGARFLANGQPRAEIADPEFARLFFGIWLSERTPEPRLRDALLGLAGRAER
jgi:hypothetical protein